jgi:hypothetical protein
VLLTRSRLCPRPKPGSSLHLHVLGTPPAFVLSQDQTLREELLQLHKRVVRGTTRRCDNTTSSHRRCGKPLGLSLVGSDPRATRHRRLGRRAGAPVHRELRDARRGQSWHRRLSRSAKRTKATAASNLDTLLGRGIDRRVRMLLSFQRPSHLSEKGLPSRGAHPGPIRIPERTGEYSAETAPRERARGRRRYRPRQHSGRARKLPGRSRRGRAGDRRSRSSRPAARCRARARRRRSGSIPRARSARRVGARASCCRG